MDATPLPALAPVFLSSELLSLVLMLLLLSLQRSGLPGVREWLLANLAIVCGLPLLGLRGVIPDVISIVLANALLAGSIALFYSGCARFLGRPAHGFLLSCGVVLQVLAVAWWRYGVDSLAWRVFATALFGGVVCLAVACLMWRHRPPGRRPNHYYLVMFLSLLSALADLVRGIYFVSLHPAPVSIMFLSGWNVLLLSVNAAIMPCLAMASILMVHDALQSEAEEVANRDFMTGAMSRKYLVTLAHQQIVQAARSRSPLSLLLIDLDHFKRINDTHGHSMGDEVLRAFVELVQDVLRNRDGLGRLGGEEFAILLPNADIPSALGVAERLRAQVEQQRVRFGAQECVYSISIGVAGWRVGESFERLYERADHALYVAKHRGRNRVEFSTLPEDGELVQA